MAARSIHPHAFADGQTIGVALDDAEHGTPALLRLLVAAGIDIVEVKAELPALEDAYLHLLQGNGSKGRTP